MTDHNRNSAITSANDLDFDDKVLNAKLPVLVDVSARWCAPCKVAHPVVASLAQTYAGRLEVVEIDGDESPAVVERLGIRGFPTFVTFANGKVVEQRAGFGGRRALEDLVRGVLE